MAPDDEDLIEGSGLDIDDEEILMRMTGCPNGCARPYMAELAFVGDGPKSYQVWLGGSPVLTRTAWPFKAKMKNEALEETMEPILAMFKSKLRLWVLENISINP